MSFSPWRPPEIPVRGGGVFPTRRIFCVGRNYADHAREMGADPTSEPPCFFAKPIDSLKIGDGEVRYPPQTQNLHHEVELVIALGAPLRDADLETARAAVFGYAVGIDLTRRDLQQAAKDRRWPWALAKGFEDAAPISQIARHPNPQGAIWLEVNGEPRQDARTSEMIFGVNELVASISTYMTLLPGDVITTGTPSGVGLGFDPPRFLQPGDVIDFGIEGIGDGRQTVVAHPGGEPGDGRQTVVTYAGR